MDKDAKEKILEYDIIRVIAVILVVLGHCTYRTIITDYGGYSLIQNIDLITPLGKIVFTIFKSITAFIFTFHMPLFFVLSGALFSNSLNRGKYKTLKELVVNKGKRLLIPFFIVTLLYAVPIKYISGYYSKSTNLFKDIFVGQILMQGNTHLWFLPTLFCIFCIIYILHRFKLPKILIIVALFLLNFFSFFPKISLLDHISLYLMYFYIGFCFEIKRNKISNEIDKMKIKEFLILIISFTIMRIGFYYIMKTRN